MYKVKFCFRAITALAYCGMIGERFLVEMGKTYIFRAFAAIIGEDALEHAGVGLNVRNCSENEQTLLQKTRTAACCRRSPSEARELLLPS